MSSYYQIDLKSLYTQFNSSDSGLNEQQISQNQKKYGLNLIIVKGKPWWQKILSPFLNVFMLILALAALVSIITNEILDGAIIIVIMAISAAIDYIQQITSERIFKALRNFDAQTYDVLRNGKSVKIESSKLVPGDIINLREGQKIPADCRILESDSTRVDESLLTGESQPVPKQNEEIAEDKPIYEQSNMLFSGSFMVSGQVKALVVSTGNNTEFGKLASLATETHQVSPVQQKIDKLITQITIVVSAASLAIFGLSLYRGLELSESIRFVLTLAVSAVPEGLPVAISVVLVLGARQLAKHNALVRNLSAIENIGIVTTIATDKTGTLTKNQLKVQQSWFFKNQSEETLKQAASCSVNRQNNQTHDPLDSALAEFGKNTIITNGSLVESYPFVQKLAMSGASWSYDDTSHTTYIKGSPEQILAHSKLTAAELKEINHKVLEFTRNGFRVIALATQKNTQQVPDKLEQLLTFKLTFIGLLAISDELRPEAIDSIHETQAAGVTVRMITGDHFETAYAIGKQLGLATNKEEVFDCRQMDNLSEAELKKVVTKTKVFSRVLPEYKHRILSILKKEHITAMTGDGVNDVPALTNAHIGIAMGSGSQIAKEAGDIVLLDNNFASIVRSLRQGRIVFDNIQRMLFYLLATNAGEVLTMVAALIIGLPIPLLPIQILWINLATDSTLVVPLGMESAEKNVMQRPPRNPARAILGRPIIIRIILVATIMAIATIAVFIYYWQTHSTSYARTIAFNVLVVMQWANAFNARSEWKSIFSRQLFSNVAFYIAILISIGIQLAALFSPLQDVLHLSKVATEDLIITSIISIVSIILASEIHKLIGRRWQGK